MVTLIPATAPFEYVGDATSDALGNVGTQGVLGALLVIFIVASAVLGKMLLNEKDKRILDSQKVQDSLVSPIQLLTVTVNSFLDKIDTEFKRRGRK